MLSKPTGQVYVFTGDGKGKTSAALGITLRALAAGLKVAIIQWYKDPAWKISEHAVSNLLTSTAKKKFQLYPMGVGFHLPSAKSAPLTSGGIVVDKASLSQHQQAATTALVRATSLLGQVDVLILDEINNAVADHLVSVPEITSLINQRGTTHLILTGRNAHPDIIKLADLVTEMKKVKHPYDQGKLAVKGLDF